jgi:hypothetical protein
MSFPASAAESVPTPAKKRAGAGSLDDAIAIRDIKRYLSDYEIAIP